MVIELSEQERVLLLQILDDYEGQYAYAVDALYQRLVRAR